MNKERIYVKKIRDMVLGKVKNNMAVGIDENDSIELCMMWQIVAQSWMMEFVDLLPANAGEGILFSQEAYDLLPEMEANKRRHMANACCLWNRFYTPEWFVMVVVKGEDATNKGLRELQDKSAFAYRDIYEIFARTEYHTCTGKKWDGTPIQWKYDIGMAFETKMSFVDFVQREIREANQSNSGAATVE